MSNNRFNRRNLSSIAGSFSFLPQITDRTADQFLEEILKIHENQYTPINNIPTIFGRKLNLLALYNAVAKRGGFKKMNTEWSWEGVLTDLKMPTNCANASVALRGIFQRYLDPFERLQRNKATINDIEEELQMESDNRYKSAAQRTTLSHCNFNPISMVYRSDIHQISSHKRQESGLSCDLAEVVEFQKLELSLKSGLPNEVEFSLNTVLLMSFQSDGVQLCRNPRLLDLILISVGIADLAILLDLGEHDQLTRRFLQFWNDSIVVENGRRFLFPDVFEIDNFKVPSLERRNTILKVYDELTVYDKEGQRIQLVATIMRNLALDPSNSHYLTQNHQCMRLIILCCYASHFALRQLGLEILSMLSFPVVGILCETLRVFLIDLINSEDRVERLRGLELLSNLSDQKVYIDNTDFLSGLPKHFFASLISMLILHDLHIVVLALEAVYGLSEVDSCLCIKLVDCSTETLSTLYILLSLEAQVMGTQSLIRIRVMQGPGVITNAHISNQSTLNKSISQPSQSNPKQLATTLMPPPPVPTHKIPTTTVMIPHGSPVKSQIYPTVEAVASPSRPQLIQKIYPVITKNNFVHSTAQTNSAVPSTVLSTMKTEMTTTSLNPLITSEVVSHNVNTIKPPTNSLQFVTTVSSNINLKCTTSPLNSMICSPVTAISPAPILSTLNHNTTIKSTCISAVNPHQLSRESPQVVNKPVTTSYIGQVIPKNCPIVLSNNTLNNNHVLGSINSTVVQTFTNKQDFVKSWLLTNYLESPQCTVPLFVMYKQLQIAVQNYFKDSEMVTAEEFHKLVRILFPQVQLVQLHTGNVVEIHYYNLKVSPKPSTLENLLESRTGKAKPNTVESSHSMNNEYHINNIPANNIINPVISNDPHTEQKHPKRVATDIINGHSTDGGHSDQCPKKKLRISNEDTSLNYDGHNQTPHNSIKEGYNSNSNINGVVVQYQQKVFNQKNQASQCDDRLSQSHTTILTSQLLNGSLVEELKHSDSETKTFSSSTVSPMHCESLANGTDGSSEETMDNELGKVLSCIPSLSSHTPAAFPPVVSHCLVTVKSESSLNTTPTLVSDTQDANTNKRNVKKGNFNQLGRTRSRFRNNNPNSKGKQRGSSSHRPHNLSYLYICEWDNCLQSFDKPQKVYGHVYTNHFMTLRTEVESMCYWAGCKDTLQRTPLPLLNHVNEQHCNNVALESARQVRLAKEKEKSPSTTQESSVVKTESDVKFLNFCPSQTNTKPATIVGPTTSYQTTPLSSQSITSSVLSKPICPPIEQCPPATSSTFVSSPSLSPVEQMIACSNILPPSHSSLPLKTSSTPLLQTSKPLVSPIIIPSQTTLHEPIIIQPPLPLLSQTTTTVDIPTIPSSTVVTQVTVSHNNTVTNPSIPVVKHALKEGPVTKHIRFLAALILRNLCQSSSEARRFVAARHQQIFEMSISGCESSKALSECLYYTSMDMTATTNQKK